MGFENFPFKYKTQASSEQMGKYAIGVKIDVAIGRDLTRDEGHVLSECITKITDMLFRGSELANPEVQTGLLEQKTAFQNMFPDGCRMVEIPNEYHPALYVNPWYKVHTNLGTIKIGWRKRVINIDWQESAITKTAQELFPDEDVTKGEKYIHAWSYKDATKYIYRLMNA